MNEKKLMNEEVRDENYKELHKKLLINTIKEVSKDKKIFLYVFDLQNQFENELMFLKMYPNSKTYNKLPFNCIFEEVKKCSLTNGLNNIFIYILGFNELNNEDKSKYIEFIKYARKNKIVISMIPNSALV